MSEIGHVLRHARVGAFLLLLTFPISIFAQFTYPPDGILNKFGADDTVNVTWTSNFTACTLGMTCQKNACNYTSQTSSYYFLSLRSYLTLNKVFFYGSVPSSGFYSVDFDQMLHQAPSLVNCTFILRGITPDGFNNSLVIYKTDSMNSGQFNIDSEQVSSIVSPQATSTSTTSTARITSTLSNGRTSPATTTTVLGAPIPSTIPTSTSQTAHTSIPALATPDATSATSSLITSPPSPSPSSTLTSEAKVGLGVGLSLGGLVAVGALIWLFLFRQRNTTSGGRISRRRIMSGQLPQFEDSEGKEIRIGGVAGRKAKGEVSEHKRPGSWGSRTLLL
ncbi:MAG: hypothetical protein M1827_003360 [Pycnora praestabilis]|nr:MAG: hypothetical protein M1827_003360 [Pycnora praestabilis]